MIIRIPALPVLNKTVISLKPPARMLRPFITKRPRRAVVKTAMGTLTKTASRAPLFIMSRACVVFAVHPPRFATVMAAPMLAASYALTAATAPPRANTRSTTHTPARPRRVGTGTTASLEHGPSARPLPSGQH